MKSTMIERKAKLLARSSQIDSNAWVDFALEILSEGLNTLTVRWDAKLKFVGSKHRNTFVGNESDLDVLVVGNSEEILDSYECRQDFDIFKERIGSMLQGAFDRRGIVGKTSKGYRLMAYPGGPQIDIIPAFESATIHFESIVHPEKHDRLRKSVGLAYELGENPVFIQNRNSDWILSLPGVHTARMRARDSQTNGKYTAVVRLLKRVRNCLRVRKKSGGTLSSYALEGLAWNVDVSAFLHSTFHETLSELERAWTLFVARKLEGWTEIGGASIPVGNYDPYQVHDIPFFCDFLSIVFELNRTLLENDRGELWDFNSWGGSSSW